MLTVVWIILVFVIFIALEVLGSSLNGPRLKFDNPARSPRTYGTGQPLTFVVLGDSTTAGEGGGYEQGVAVSAAQHLAESRAVKFVNLSVAGARSADVLVGQADAATALNPDVVLISVGANDVTHVTSHDVIADSIELVVIKLIKQNCNVRVILTGSPDMGTVPRILVPLRTLAGARTVAVNRIFEAIVAKRKLTFAPIARETGPVFRAHPELYAADKFHPNDAGYDIWKPVINRAIDQALADQSTHCS